MSVVSVERVDDKSGIAEPLATPRPSVVVSRYFGRNSWLDLMLALILIVPGTLLTLFLIGLIRATSRGPGIFRQVRVGKGGRKFVMYKLRTMRVDAETATGPIWTANVRDSRITGVGKWLRRLHLDELPQLFNVLKGEMSLIGPRPERPEFVTVLSLEIPGYRDRLLVRPGVTGLAQINLPPDTDLDSVRRKLVLDREYIGTANLILDLRILLSTLFRMFGVSGERAMRLMRLYRPVNLPNPSGNEQPAVTPEQLLARHKEGLASMDGESDEDEFQTPGRILNSRPR